MWTGACYKRENIPHRCCSFLVISHLPSSSSSLFSYCCCSLPSLGPSGSLGSSPSGFLMALDKGTIQPAKLANWESSW